MQHWLRQSHKRTKYKIEQKLILLLFYTTTLIQSVEGFNHFFLKAKKKQL